MAVLVYVQRYKTILTRGIQQYWDTGYHDDREPDEECISVSVTSSDYYNISLTANSVCSGNLTISVSASKLARCTLGLLTLI